MFRKAIAAVLLLFTLSVSISAQDKYEYAIVRYWTISGGGDANGVWINYAGKDWEQVVKVDYKEMKSGPKSPYGVHYGPLLQYIEKMTAEGWEIFAVSDGMSVYTIRRKKAN